MGNTLVKHTEWEGEHVRLVQVSGFRLHPNFPHGHKGKRGGKYYEIQNRPIEAVIAHQLAGAFKVGEATVHGLSRYATSDPKYRRNPDGSIYMRDTRKGRRPQLVGGGRGWPGAPYPFLVPYYPEAVDGKFEVYRLWDDDMVTYHSGRRWNKRGIAVGFGGSLDSRHAPRFSADTGRDPSPQQFLAGTELIMDYLLPRYGLTAEDGLLGHFDVGKATCPGDVLEAWIRRERGEEVNWLEPGRAPWDDTDPDMVDPPKEDRRRELETWKQRQEALVELGYDVGDAGADGVHGYFTRMAVRAFQDTARIVADGIWGPQTEKHLRRALAAQ